MHVSKLMLSIYITKHAMMVLEVAPCREPGPRLNIKTIFPRYGDFHIKDKTVVRPSYIQHGDPYTGKATSLYWDARRSTGTGHCMIWWRNGQRQGQHPYVGVVELSTRCMGWGFTRQRRHAGRFNVPQTLTPRIRAVVIQYLENHVRQKVLLVRIIPQSRTVMQRIQVSRSLREESSGQQHLIKQHGSSSTRISAKYLLEHSRQVPWDAWHPSARSSTSTARNGLGYWSKWSLSPEPTKRVDARQRSGRWELNFDRWRRLGKQHHYRGSPKLTFT